MGKLARLPPEAQEALQWLAALGNTADFAVLALVLGDPRGQSMPRSGRRCGRAWSAAGRGLRLPARPGSGGGLFVDPRRQRANGTLRIGRILASGLPPEQVAERIFDIVTQLNRGAALVDAPEERERIAELDLQAGERAKAPRPMPRP